MKLPETRYARSGDLRIAYQVTGHGPFDLVLVPGFLSNLEVHWEDPGYSHLMRRLAGFARLIQFDKRGTGLSDRVDPANLPDLETRIDDIRAVMEAAGSGRAALLGASEGAPMAMLFATTYPERTRSLVLYGGYAHFHKWVLGPEAVDRFVAAAERSWGTGASIKLFAPSRVSDPYFSAWWARFERLSCTPTAAIAQARMDEQVDLRGVLVRIRAPTLVLHRRGDARVDPAAGRYLATHIPGARFVELAGRDHALWIGDIDAAVDAIEAFLTGLPPRPPPQRVLAALLALRVSGPERRAAWPSDRRWLETLERFGRTVEDTARRLGGQVLRAAGEAALLRFDGPGQALRAASALRDAARAEGLQVAQGVHVGEMETGDDGVAGAAPRNAQRIAAVAARRRNPRLGAGGGALGRLGRAFRRP